MSKFSEYVSSQFRNPRGIGGKIVSLIQNTVNRKMYKTAVSLVNLGKADRILDVGYGNGHLLKRIYKKQPVSLYGIDISADAKKMAERKNTRALKSGNLHLSVGDCCSLPYEDNMFSAVTTINTIYFWQDTVKGLTEIRRILKEGCSFINLFYSIKYLDRVKYTQVGYKKFTVDELVQAGKDAGFNSVEVKDIVTGENFAVIYTK